MIMSVLNNKSKKFRVGLRKAGIPFRVVKAGFPGERAVKIEPTHRHQVNRAIQIWAGMVR